MQEALEVLALLRTLRRDLVRRSRAELARSGLTAAQLSVISVLGTRGALTLTELSSELELSHSTVSGIVDRLQARGIVQRTPSPTDRRSTRIALTEQAQRHALALGDGGPGARLVAALAAATPDERRAIRHGLALLRRFVEAAAD